MKPGRINLSLGCFTNADANADEKSVIAVDARLTQPYTDGKPDASKPAVQKVDVVFPKNGFEALTVTVANPNPDLKDILETSKVPVYVKFKGFTARLYTMHGKTDVSAKAKSVEILMDDLSWLFDTGEKMGAFAPIFFPRNSTSVCLEAKGHSAIFRCSTGMGERGNCR